MITLFRRIRQKLIGSGSVPRYLLYATGEILLVVVGILIALQVNNWNEERRANDRAYQYHQRLVEEARMIVEESDINLRDFRRDYFKYRQALKALKQGSMNAEEQEAMEDFLLDYFKFNLSQEQIDTFNEMLGAGELDLIRNSELRSGIADFREFQEFYLRLNLINNEMAMTKSDYLEPYVEYLFEGELPDSNSVQPANEVRYDFKAMAADPVFINRFSRTVYLWHDTYRLAVHYNNRAKELLEELEQELEGFRE